MSNVSKIRIQISKVSANATAKQDFADQISRQDGNDNLMFKVGECSDGRAAEVETLEDVTAAKAPGTRSGFFWDAPPP